MADNPHIAHVRSMADLIGRQNAATRDIVAKSREILRTPPPDTFLGRKTQQPFPDRDDETAETESAASVAE